VVHQDQSESVIPSTLVSFVYEVDLPSSSPSPSSLPK
jgi:hypothetical protein